MNTMFHRCPRYSVRSVHLRPLLLENFLDILAARRHLAVTYSKCRSRHRARIDPMTRCHSPSTPIHRRAPRPRRRPRPTAREPMSTRRVFRPPHALLVTRVSPNQSNAALLIGARAKTRKPRRLGTGRQARAQAAAAPSARSASNVHKLANAKYARLKRPVLRTHHRRVRRGSSSYAAASRGSGEHRSRAPPRTPSSPLQRGSATTAHDAAATAGLTV